MSIAFLLFIFKDTVELFTKLFANVYIT